MAMFKTGDSGDRSLRRLLGDIRLSCRIYAASAAHRGRDVMPRKTQARDIRAVMKHLGLIKRSFVGHDLGGMWPTHMPGRSIRATVTRLW